jgi:hypothetical protein
MADHNSIRTSLTGEDWTSDEIAAIVRDYFEMLTAEMAGKPYNKSAHRRRLQARLRGRSEQSIEFKHSNISAVLYELRQPFIDGYKPRGNRQQLLAEYVEEFLDQSRAVITTFLESPRLNPPAVPVHAENSFGRALDSPPVWKEQGSSQRPWIRSAGRRIDFAARDFQNRRLGRMTEEWVVGLEKHRLRSSGRDDLARKVSWVSDAEGDGAGFDILSFNGADDDRERWIEVKGTGLGKYFPFYVSSNEVECSVANPSRYHLYRVFDFSRSPRLFVLPGDLSKACELNPSQYLANVRRA